MPKRILFLFTFFVLIISSSFTYALSVKPLDLRQITVFADRIFKGTVKEVKTDFDDYESNYKVTYTTFDVDECLKGACGKSITVKQVANSRQGIPTYQVGKTYLMFFPEDSAKTGLVAPVGIWQGMYLLEKKGEKWVVPQLRSSSSGLKNLKAENLNTDDYESFKTVIQKIVEDTK